MSEPLHPSQVSPAEAEQHLRQLRRRERALLLVPTLALGSLVLALWVFAGWMVFERPHQLRNQQQHELAAAARAAAMQTESVLRQAEAALHVVDFWVTQQRSAPMPGDIQLAQLADSLRGSSGKMIDVVLLTGSGRVQRLQSGPVTGLGASGPAVYAELAKPDSDGLHIGLPLQLDTSTSEPTWLLPLVLRLSRPVGEFDRVMALVELRRLRDMQSLFLSGPDAALLMLRTDGAVLLREPSLPGLMGRRLFESNPARRQDFADMEGRFVSDGAATDGLARVGAYATLGDFGIKLLMSISETGLQAAHSWQRNGVLAATAILTVLIVALARWLTELQRTARLRAAEMRATSNAMPLGLFRCDASGETVYANDTYLSLHKLQRKDLAWGWTALVPPDERDMLILRWKHHMASGEPLNLVRRVRLPGELRSRLLSLHTAPLIVAGHTTGQVGTVEDVTERGEQELAQRTLAAILAMTPNLVVQVNERGDVGYLNPAARERLHLSPEAPLTELHLPDLLDQQQLQLYQEQVLPAAMRDGHWLGALTLTLDDGAAVPVDATVLAHLDPRGRLETVSLLLRDISEPLRIQRERERQEAILLAVTHTARSLFVVGDTEGRLLFCNAAFERERGVRMGDWVGRPLAELYGRQDYAARHTAIAAALHGELRHLEIAAGDTRTGRAFDAQFAPLRVQSGQIEGVIVIEVDVTEARREQARLRLASQTDALTQLLNRAGFDAGTQQRMQDARQEASGRYLALLYLDLDRFKPVNDTYGHPTGDALLKAVALRLRHTLRPDDLVARLGGDEFAVMLTQLGHPEDVGRIADKLLRVVTTPFHIGDLRLEIGVSIGYSVVRDGQAELHDLVAAADSHLYEAKRAGRGSWRGSALLTPDSPA